MENYNNMMNNDQYNAMVYGGNMQQQHPMTSIPREMQIPQNQQPMHQQISSQQADIINLSYHQREMIQPHPNLPQQMGLFPVVSIPPQIQQHNHILQQQQQQHPVNINPEISQNVNIQYSIDNVSVNVNLDVQNNNDNFEPDAVKDSIPDESDPNSQLPTVDESINETMPVQDDQSQSLDQSAPESKPEESNKKKEPEVDPNQCRVCKSPEQLIDIFAIEEEMRICDIIMKICSTVRIHERDYLPHMICLGCLGKLRTAYQFVKEVQVTDKELRGKLKRSKSKIRKPSDGFVLIDCNEFSESEDDDANDDEEYKISDVEEEEESSETGSESEGSRKTKPLKKRGTKRTKSKKVKSELVTTAKRLKRDLVFIEADNSEEEKPKKKEKCKECNKVFSNKNSLRLHRKNAHFRSGEDAPFKCHICGRGFKYSINLTSHMQIHKESYSCDECGRVFASKSDVKKHALNQHKCSLSYECNKCRRLYCSVKRYQKHREQCSDYGSASKKKLQKVKEDFSFAGRDLFKTVAPVTTTYWSDSFSD